MESEHQQSSIIKQRYVNPKGTSQKEDIEDLLLQYKLALVIRALCSLRYVMLTSHQVHQEFGGLITLSAP